MKPHRRAIASLLVVFLLQGSAWAEGDDPPDVDAFLRAWVDGKAEYRFQTKFHELFPRSPHKRDTERFEAAWQCFNARKALDDGRRAALVQDLLARFDREETPDEIRCRVVFLLAHLQIREVVPRLARAARAGDSDLRDAAVEALGFFGSRPPEDLFSVFGGRLWSVALPACPDPRATKALLAALTAAKDARCGRLSAVIRALETHSGPAVEEIALELGESVARSCDLLAALDTSKTVRRLVEIAGDTEDPRRNSAIEALGETSRKEGVRALIEFLLDESAEIRKASEESLVQILEGRRPHDREIANGGARRAYWLQRLGENLEKVDEEAIRSRRTRKPGVYKYGL